MPVYEYKCECGTYFEIFLKVADCYEPQICECGKEGIKQLPRISVFVSPDICYDSPIDGRHITSKKARLEDLARNNCQEYDPGMKQDYERRCKTEQEKLEKIVDESVDEAIALMPPQEREKLDSELQCGADVSPVRLNVAAKPLTVEISNV